MLVYQKGDMFDSRAIAFVNPVNCVGVMGAGLALTFKRAFPGNFVAYEAACREGKLKPGRILPFFTGGVQPVYVINFATKQHFRNRSKLTDVANGLDCLATFIVLAGLRSVAVPALGCGLGKLAWADVEPLIRMKLSGLRDCVTVCYLPGS